jgi:hypothetical protein
MIVPRPAGVSRACTLALIAGLSCSGCSFVFMRPPSTPSPPAAKSVGQPAGVECSSSRLAPAVDVLGAVALAGLVGLFTLCPAGFDHEGEGPPPTCTAQLGASVAGTATYATSAVYGFISAATCDAAQERGRAMGRRIDSRAPAASASTFWYPGTP